MLNKRLIIIQGMQRSGTNLAWNLLQSHPEIIPPTGGETGQIIFPKWAYKGPLKAYKVAARKLIRAGFGPCLRHVDKALYRAKLASLEHESNKYKNEYEIYTKKEVEDAFLVTKSAGKDVFLTPALNDCFVHTPTISLVRNGLAVCEGWIRRGFTPRKAARTYNLIMNEILRQNETLEKHLVIRFEDCIKNPFYQVKKMWRFVNVSPKRVDRIRIQIKNVLGKNGSHTPLSGSAGEKVWVDSEQAKELLDPSVNERQIQNLSGSQQKTITDIAGQTMRHLGYKS